MADEAQERPVPGLPGIGADAHEGHEGSRRLEGRPAGQPGDRPASPVGGDRRYSAQRALVALPGRAASGADAARHARVEEVQLEIPKAPFVDDRVEEAGEVVLHRGQGEVEAEELAAPAGIPAGDDGSARVVAEQPVRVVLGDFAVRHREEGSQPKAGNEAAGLDVARERRHARWEFIRMGRPVADALFPAVVDLEDDGPVLGEEKGVDEIAVGRKGLQVAADDRLVDVEVMVVPGFKAADRGAAAPRGRRDCAEEGEAVQAAGGVEDFRELVFQGEIIAAGQNCDPRDEVARAEGGALGVDGDANGFRAYEESGRRKGPAAGERRGLFGGRGGAARGAERHEGQPQGAGAQHREKVGDYVGPARAGGGLPPPTRHFADRRLGGVVDEEVQPRLKKRASGALACREFASEGPGLPAVRQNQSPSRIEQIRRVGGRGRGLRRYRRSRSRIAA